MSLTVADFAAFVGEMHSKDGPARTPFPWQQALVSRVVERGWPKVIDVPTGLGKTSVIDVYAFTAALAPESVPRRLFFVIDRRIVVDEAYEHASRVEQALRNARPGTIARQVADALRLPGDERPLEVTRMRGGVTWAWRWVDRPDRRAIVVGTVDQVGSRLLFRGYGVSDRLRPIDAALVGTDSLIVIDEAHLSDAFVCTVHAATGGEPPALTQRPQVVTMSATPARGDEDVHGITDADRADPIAARRLTAGKRLRTVLVETTPAREGKTVPAALASLAESLAADAGPGCVVGVVVNTVARARAAFELLRARNERAVLLTGRVRPVDRDMLLTTWYPSMRAGRVRSDGPPTYVVATQTIEVGANIDFDGLVTESAPLPSLVQRLGRLNRLGDAPGAAAAVVVHNSAAAEADEVYGEARLATWHWLTERLPSTPPDAAEGATTDASPAALRELLDATDAQIVNSLLPTPPYVPVLFERTLDSWVRTAPAPAPDTPVAPFLHGIDRPSSDVSIVWREGADVGELRRDLLAVPPAAEEMLDVSLAAARRWLTAREVALLADEGGATLVADDETDARPAQRLQRDRNGAEVRPVRYRGPDDIPEIRPNQIAPGDVIVVSAAFGGCDEFGWHPGSTQPVIDVADLADRRGRPLVRARDYLVTTVAPRYGPDVADVARAMVDLLAGPEREDHTQLKRTLKDMLRVVTSATDALPLRRSLAGLGGRADPTLPLSGDDDELRLPYPLVSIDGHAAVAEDRSEFGSSAGGHKVSLLGHQAAVSAKAVDFARSLHLPDEVVEAVRLAALWHDEGKRDPRFQAMLHGEQAYRAWYAEPLAKSGMAGTDRAAFRRARERSGYPLRMRHEALSARAAAAWLEHSDGDVDADLVRHLVASHHGWSRPLLPPVIDPDPRKVDFGNDVILDSSECVDLTQPARFARLNARYGRWGLALLETVVRLADIHCSETGESHDIIETGESDG